MILYGHDFKKLTRLSPYLDLKSMGYIHDKEYIRLFNDEHQQVKKDSYLLGAFSLFTRNSLQILNT